MLSAKKKKKKNTWYDQLTKYIPKGIKKVGGV